MATSNQVGKSYNLDLVIVVLMSLLLVPMVIFTSGVLRAVLGLAFTLFLPGYALIAALFPKKSDIGNIERLALSFGLSIAVVPLTGLILNYTPWGIRLYPVLISLLSFIFVAAGVAWFRRRKLSEEDRFALRFRHRLSELFSSWGRQGRWDKVLNGLLVAAIVCAVGTLAYAVAMPQVGEKFTEFYILGQEGSAAQYPRELVLGESAVVGLGIVNHEQAVVDYRVEIAIDGEKVREIAPIVLDHEEKWEGEAIFIASKVGPSQRVSFLLYKADSVEVYLELHLWVDVEQSL